MKTSLLFLTSKSTKKREEYSGSFAPCGNAHTPQVWSPAVLKKMAMAMLQASRFA